MIGNGLKASKAVAKISIMPKKKPLPTEPDGLPDADPIPGQGKARKYHVRPELLPLLEHLAARHLTGVTELVNRGVREMLEREGLWPPVQTEAKDAR